MNLINYLSLITKGSGGGTSSNPILNETPSIEQVDKILNTIIEMDDNQIKQLITEMQSEFIQVNDTQNGSEYYVTNNVIIPKHDTDTIRKEYLTTMNGGQKQVLFTRNVDNGLNDLFLKLQTLENDIDFEANMRNIPLTKPDIVYPDNPSMSYPGFKVIPQYIYPI